ncbi:MAG: glutamine-hydrolyzing GMP synthase [Bacilli bacterium]|nr:glutamine-hydrolyzing GMP synthase [Bacilli bacterium]
MKKNLTLGEAKKFIALKIKEIKKEVGKKNVLLALSGGVDSMVVGKILEKAIGNQLMLVHINSGLLRIGDSEWIIKKINQSSLKTNFKYVDASKIFLKNLKNIQDSEKKRKIIGYTFIDILTKTAKKNGITFLAQGTIYPDILESKNNIKAHHNVGGLPKKMDFKLIEPLKTLYKDEVRVVGKALGLEDDFLNKQPFPGPGLAVRCLGKITLERLNILKKSDKILREEFDKCGLSKKVWQFFTIISDVKRMGINKNKRFSGFVIIIRAVRSVDAMTAQAYEIPFNVLNTVVERITKLKFVSRVVYDLTPKPCGTIEWE